MNKKLENYAVLVDFLAQVLGPNAEVVLHDVTTVDSSIVAIKNGHVSNRTVGMPATNLALKILGDAGYAQKGYLVNYNGMLASGKHLKSSTFYIKDEDGSIIGLICINIDQSKLREARDVLNSLMNSLIGEESQGLEFADPANTEFFPRSVDELTRDTIDAILGGYEAGGEIQLDEKMDLIRRLNAEGVFLIKGSVNRVARALNTSEPTVYRYLAKIKNE